MEVQADQIGNYMRIAEERIRTIVSTQHIISFQSGLCYVARPVLLIVLLWAMIVKLTNGYLWSYVDMFSIPFDNNMYSCIQ